jgi:hypothetical protein
MILQDQEMAGSGARFGMAGSGRRWISWRSRRLVERKRTRYLQCFTFIQIIAVSVLQIESFVYSHLCVGKIGISLLE